METNALRKHFDYLIQCTEKLKLSKPVFDRYRNHYEEIFLYCGEKHLDIFTCQDAAEFCRAACPSRKGHAVKETTKIAYTVAGYFKNGYFTWETVTSQQFPVSETYGALLDSFRQELLKKLSPGTVRVGMTIIRQFLYFLEQRGTTDADRFLQNAGRHSQKSLPCFTDDGPRLIFRQIDRSTDKGRRDYAIFLLSLRTGLRASDITRLKLTDINWDEKTIHIIQQKTRLAVSLPLPVDAGNAVADYILHSRYKTDNPYIFLRLREPPSPAPMNPTSFNGYLRRYMEAAGIKRTGWDGRPFHAL